MRLGSFSCEAVALPGSSPQDIPAADMAGPKHDSHSPLSPHPAPPFPSNKGRLCPASRGSPGSFKWFFSADPRTSLSCSQQLWMEREQQLNPSTSRVWMGTSKPEAREVVGTVQHAHGVVTPRARGCGTARPAQPTWGAGAAAPG